MSITKKDLREKSWDIASQAIDGFCDTCSPYSSSHPYSQQTLDLADIQGIILRGYGTHKAADFVLLKIIDAKAARRWLASLAGDVMDAQHRPVGPCFNLAFTFSGLEALGLSAETLVTFAAEFTGGMAGDNQHRSRILGDVGDSAPEHWQWGGPHTDAVHLVLLLYSADEQARAAYYRQHESRFADGGVQVVEKLDTSYLNDRKEHFGFRDGIGQPRIADYKGNKPGVSSVNPGEFILGYENEYGALPPSPTVAAPSDSQNVLPESSTGGAKDLGKNGSYLVFRQLGQKVSNFWQFANQHAHGDSAERIRLASKMVGRWPSGAPMALSPDLDDPRLSNEDKFLYYGDDPHGDKCPIGSHVRRTNPRDSLEPQPGSEASLKVGNRHRILRRGRAYGKPAASSMNPEEIFQAGDDGEARGLHFLCFNTNITRQFEFIQFTWANNKKFDGLYNDPDPLIGGQNPGTQDGSTSGDFTIQGQPVRQRLTGLQRFVDVKGGAYFFMPGKAAIRYIASLPD